MQKRQILVIHGGDFFDTQEEFLQYLKTEPVSKEDLIKEDKKRWKENLQTDLGDAYEVLQPVMPSKYNAKYVEWKTWFERIAPLLEDGVALVGHSLGGIFLERYLSENEFPKKIGGLFLLAAPYFEERHSAGFYTVSAEKLRAQAQTVFIYHSEDDDIVPFDHAKKNQELIPEAKLVAFKDRGHLYAQEHFPELVEHIKSLK